jgi:predicted peptidase
MSLLALSILFTAPLARAQSAEALQAYEELSVTYTGGTYKNEVFRYRLMKPAQVEAGKKYPLVLFLHGRGECGDDNKVQLKHFPERMAKPEYREKFPSFVLVPQCRKNQSWSEASWNAKEPGPQLAAAILALKRTIRENPVDEKRVYLTGLSLGGFGSWNLAARHPDGFAAVAPICGGGDPGSAAKLAKVNIWAWHGDADTVVPPGRSRDMISAIKKAGGNPRYTELPGVGHDSWTPAYSDASDQGLLAWMFQQTLGKPAKPQPAASGNKPKPQAETKPVTKPEPKRKTQPEPPTQPAQ